MGERAEVFIKADAAYEALKTVAAEYYKVTSQYCAAMGAWEVTGWNRNSEQYRRCLELQEIWDAATKAYDVAKTEYSVSQMELQKYADFILGINDKEEV